MLKKSFALAGSAAIIAVGFSAVPAHAGPATGSDTIGPGSVLRAQFRQNVDGSGYYWRTNGTSNCTAGTGNVDTFWNDMDSTGRNWNDVASYAADYAQCDIQLFRNTGRSQALTGYVNYGSGRSLAGDALNNRTSSYNVS